MKALLPVAKLLGALTFVGAAGYFLYTQAEPLLTPACSKPIMYSVGTLDPRFNISESQFKTALQNAASVWNTEAGKKLIVVAPEEEESVVVNLEYSDVQKATELGKNIDAEQGAYDAKKAEVNELKDSFDSAKRSYERKAAAYDESVATYEKDVAYWNDQGGAPPAEYDRLQARSKNLESDRRSLNGEADEVNEFSKRINMAVAELNGIAQKINAKVNAYNMNAGEDFDQGNYESDASGERITIYEFENRGDLERVLVHEFGHALGLGHVENPDSIMYSFNIGDGLGLTDEDKAELRTVCKLD